MCHAAPPCLTALYRSVPLCTPKRPSSDSVKRQTTGSHCSNGTTGSHPKLGIPLQQRHHGIPPKVRDPIAATAPRDPTQSSGSHCSTTGSHPKFGIPLQQPRDLCFSPTKSLSLSRLGEPRAVCALVAGCRLPGRRGRSSASRSKLRSVDEMRAARRRTCTL